MCGAGRSSSPAGGDVAAQSVASNERLSHYNGEPQADTSRIGHGHDHRTAAASANSCAQQSTAPPAATHPVHSRAFLFFFSPDLLWVQVIGLWKSGLM